MAGSLVHRADNKMPSKVGVIRRWLFYNMGENITYLLEVRDQNQVRSDLPHLT